MVSVSILNLTLDDSSGGIKKIFDPEGSVDDDLLNKAEQ